MQLLDTSDVFVDVLLDERYFGDIQPGDRVVIKWIGSHAKVAGFVREVLGQVAVGENSALVAETLRRAATKSTCLYRSKIGRRRPITFIGITLANPPKFNFPRSDW